jgi:hypothetical protein
MPEAVADIEQLDQHLLEVVRALHSAVKQGVSHADDSMVVSKAIADCQEILDVVMAGDVKEWLN